MSYDYEYMDDLLDAETSSEDSAQERSSSSKVKSELDFTVSSELDGILGDQKVKLVNLLKADHDDLLIMQSLKKTSPLSSNGSSTMRTRGQANPRPQVSSATAIQESFQQV